MKKLSRIGLLAVTALALARPTVAETKPGAVPWRSWSDSVFVQARQEGRLVLLDLEAVWCHWCHVMDRETYADSEVAELIRRRYLPVKVDQDAAPDLANRYRDYGWPATVVFDAEGKELAKRAGFLPPGEMAALLRQLAEHPESVALEAEPKPVFAAQGVLPDDLRRELQRRHREAFDPEQGGLRLNHKFIDPDSIEYGLRLAQAGAAEEGERAQRSLKQGLALLDPVWGGVYQYSHGGDWSHPHFEKIMAVQRDYLRVYALAYAAWGDPQYRRMAEGVKRYLKDFLRGPGGGFYTSQDADRVPGEHGGEYFALEDAGRRRLGMPRIDRHRYARENGWAIEGLVQWYRASGDPEALALAREAAEWSLRHRSLDRSPYQAALWLAFRGSSPAGGFRHGEESGRALYLGDSLAMARAFLALYGATGKRDWLSAAERSAGFILREFSAPNGAGFLTAASQGPLPPLPTREENIAAARFYNLLFHYSGRREYVAAAETAMRYLASPEVATENMTEPGVLLADEELRSDPLHVTVVGKKDDPAAAVLFQAAQRLPTGYLRVEWWDRREGPMPRPDVQYPELERSAAFVCSQGLCSSPLYDSERLRERVEKLGGRPS